MSILNPNNPVFQVIVSLLIGILVGSATTAVAIQGTLGGVGPGIDEGKFEELRNSTKDINDLLQSVENEVMRIESKLDENMINVGGDYIKYLRDVLSAIDSEVNKIEEKLDANDIDVNGTFASNIYDQLTQLQNLLKNLNVTSINQNITNVNQNINNIFNTVNNIKNIVNNINNTVVNNHNFILNIYETINNINVTINQIYDILSVTIVDQLTIIETTITEIHSLTVNIVDMLVVIQQQMGDLINIVVNIQENINNIINTLIVIDFKTQKEVIIELEHISDVPDPYVRRFIVAVSLEGEGGLPSTSISRIFILDVPDAEFTINETGEPGIYIVTATLPDSLPSGSYILVIESEVTLTLPDGSTETFKGRDISILYVW